MPTIKQQINDAQMNFDQYHFELRGCSTTTSDSAPGCGSPSFIATI